MSNDEQCGLALDNDGSWMLEPISKRTDIAVFLRSLPLLFNDECVIAFGDVIAPEIKDFIIEREPEDKPDIFALQQSSFSVMLTLVPPFIQKRNPEKPLHMEMTADNLHQLADISERYAEPEVCDSLAVYKGKDVLMEYNDAFHIGMPFISGLIEEEKIKAFSEAVGFKYSKYYMD